MSERPTTTIYEFTVPPGQHESIRLDVYITSFVENATRSKVQEAIKQGYVWVNGKHEKASYTVPQPATSISGAITFLILFE